MAFYVWAALYYIIFEYIFLAKRSVSLFKWCTETLTTKTMNKSCFLRWENFLLFHSCISIHSMTRVNYPVLMRLWNTVIYWKQKFYIICPIPCWGTCFVAFDLLKMTSVPHFKKTSTLHKRTDYLPKPGLLHLIEKPKSKVQLVWHLKTLY